MEPEIRLTPVQQVAFDGLLAGIAASGVLVLRGDAGMGKTTILKKFHAAVGGAFVGVREFMETLAARQTPAIEEAFLAMIEEALASHNLVIVDDLHLVTNVVDRYHYPRRYLLEAALTSILGEAGARKKKLLFGVDGDSPWPIRRRAWSWQIGELAPADYESLCRIYLDADLDYAKVHRFAPRLNAHQLKNACLWLGREGRPDTDRFIEYLGSQNMTSNVEIEEVAPVDWHDLKGVDDVIQALEAKIALPLENDALAAELHLKPKRGVLLAGPPGTGKTTIGRALAHRLKGKFFLVDGTVVAGSGEFYDKVGEVFEAAKRNAPSVVFIDDADVIFEGESERGFYRYLLTMLDGLESASAERVCVMITAMNASSLPAAMLRSGRIELWLETRAPDMDARAAILREKLSKLPQPIGTADIDMLASATRGLTGADLKAVVEDAKLLFAHDKATGKVLRPSTEYFLEAIETVRANRRNYLRSKPSRLTEVVKLGFE
jgi:transitional endoplasmic reticulum ATPase